MREKLSFSVMFFFSFLDVYQVTYYFELALTFWQLGKKSVVEYFYETFTGCFDA